jgi:hypothetical protein
VKMMQEVGKQAPCHPSAPDLFCNLQYQRQLKLEVLSVDIGERPI